MSLNMKTLTQALAKTAAVIEKTVQTTVQEVAGPKALQDYDLMDQIGSAGPGLAWRLYSAKAARDSSRQHQYSTVCVWVLDKKALTEARTRAGLSKAAEDSFLDVIRADASRLVRLRHPGVVHVVQALDDSKNAMTMVTEPLFSSVANALGNLENVAKVPKELNGMEMSLLEVKHGLLQIAESLEFIHNNANLIHRAISPENVLITSNGAWKICGFGFAISKDQASGDSSYIQSFHYSDYDVEDSVLPNQPSINYTAPELVRSKTNSVGTFSDIFSFGCLAYHLIVRKPLFDCKNNVKMYMNSLTYLSSNAFISIPSELVADLQKMLSANESLRPTALEFTGSPFFRNDTRLRALRFLDHMLGRDNMQKTEFLKALADMWKDFDARVLRYKVLPPLCAELRNLVMQPMILPMVLTIAESQDKNDFELSTFPDLVPVLSNASGETLLLLMKHSEFIINKSCQENLIAHILPLFVRAYDDTDPRIQEEALKKSVPLSKHLDLQKVKQYILPQVHALALKTTVAAVRVNALLCFGELTSSLDKQSVMEILQTIERCTGVDRSAPTLMCSLGVGNAILKQFGVEFAAENVLPLLIPLLVSQQLNVQQFAKYMMFVKDVLRKIEETKGVMVSESVPSHDLPPSLPLNRNFERVASANKNSNSLWDEDWGTTNKPPLTKVPTKPVDPLSNFAWPPPQTANLALSGQTIQPSKPADSPLDFYWPPAQPTNQNYSVALGLTVQPTKSVDPLPDFAWTAQSRNENQPSFDEMDPFANWPPRSGGRGGVTNNGSNQNGWGMGMNPSNGNGDFAKMVNHGYGSGSLGSVGEPKNVMGSSAIKLAPPPTAGTGKGRGGSGFGKKPTGQHSLLDLL